PTVIKNNSAVLREMRSSMYALMQVNDSIIAIAEGLLDSKVVTTNKLILTKRNLDKLSKFSERGVKVISDNIAAVKNSTIIILSVTPQKMDSVIEEIKDFINPKKHIILSVITGAGIADFKEKLGNDVPVIRVMPNTAIAIKESMTCISANKEDLISLKTAEMIFNTVGKTKIINEDLMGPATALVACGIAFFLRAIRAAGQGGTEIGFHAEDAIIMAAQTAKGAASLLANDGYHPEREIDKVTTPQGLTITGLNQMEHNGFSSAMITGIVSSAKRAETIFKKEK
nr:NAD(P)-binding domain-containing protein [Melioribacteraceae bacterium]